jgi:hypothetical protein
MDSDHGDGDRTDHGDRISNRSPRTRGGSEQGDATRRVPLEVTARLERMEQAIDSIAVEVERISEGQRFTTKLPLERTAPPSGAGPSPPGS